MNRTAIEETYKSRIEFFRLEVVRLQKIENRLMFLRLIAFLVAVAMFFFFLGTSLPMAFILLFIGLAFLGYLMNYNLGTIRMKLRNQYLQEINEKELLCITGDFKSFPDGFEHFDKNHPYTSDLDIFGKASLFQYINRTTSMPGNQLLAQWLKAPAGIGEIHNRQEAIEDLIPLLEFRQKLLAVEYHYAESASNPETILSWANQKPVVSNQSYLVSFTSFMSFVIFLVIVLLFFGLSYTWLTLVILINLLIAGIYTKRVNQIHRDVTKTVGLLQAYTNTIDIIENETFHSPKLTSLQLLFKGREHGAARQLKDLSKLVNKLDYRLNFLVGICLNILLFWDIRQSIKLEAWKDRNRDFIGFWFAAMAEFEALSSLATAGYNNPAWIMPTVLPTHFTMHGINIGHPLIPESRRVCNSLVIDGVGKIALITGSNMSGKSTFQRTCGINIVLAMTGAPVCATKFEI